MPLLDWLRPPRHLLVLFLLVTLVPSSLFIVFGWRSMEQDQTLERQRSGERIQQTADLAVSTLDQELSMARQALRTPATLPGLDEGADSVVVHFWAEAVETHPNNRLAWYPVVPPGNEASPDRFADVEELEIVRKDYPAAMQVLRELARSPEAAVRAGALIRLARNFVKSGQPDAALSAYQDAAALGQATVAGVPADLLARWARCGLLEQLQRSGQLREEARVLYGEMSQGQFRLTRPAYEMHRSDIRRWAEGMTDARAEDSARLLAEAVEWLWSEWKQGRSPNRITFATGGKRFIVLSQASGGRFTALVAGPRYVERQWLAKLDALAHRQNLKVSLDGESRDGGQWAARRAATQTGLPWTLTFEDTGREAETVRMAGRRRLWLAGLCLLAGLVIAGTYFIARAMTRELALAQLQSDFVSSVSHEFRTPLTSLSQLVEILMERRITTEERRATYYQAMARQTDRLRRLVESLLDFGRMEAGASPYRMQLLDACALVRSVVDQFGQEAARLGYHVELELDGVAATIAGDRDALTNVLWNLLDNAVKYSPQCRTVWVAVEHGPKFVSIHVRDRGLGIPNSEQKDVFRKFVRGAAAKAEGIHGTGIGLAMVKHIVTAHSGEIQLESKPGEGSTFTVLLPMEESCPAS